MSEWWENGDYDGTDCKNCGRTRVMKVDAPDGSIHRVCEKCGWDQEAAGYATALDIAALFAAGEVVVVGQIPAGGTIADLVLFDTPRLPALDGICAETVRTKASADKKEG